MHIIIAPNNASNVNKIVKNVNIILLIINATFATLDFI